MNKNEHKLSNPAFKSQPLKRKIEVCTGGGGGLSASSLCCLSVGSTDEKTAWERRVHAAGASLTLWLLSQRLSPIVSPSLITCPGPWRFVCDLITSPPHLFLELNAFSSRKAKRFIINAPDKSQASLRRAEPYSVSI